MVVLAAVNDIARTQAGRTARQLSDHPWLERLARIGFLASGLLHLVIGWVAARIALGGEGEADQGGALQEVRDAPFGGVLLWGAVLGFLALALFQLLDGLVRRGELTDRVKALSRSVLYAVLGGTALMVARGGSTDGEETTTDVTATLLQAPMGRFLVGGMGLAVVGVAIYHAYKGGSKKFLETLTTTGSGAVGTGVVAAGMVGYLAKGVALLIVGLFFLVAAWTADPEEARGLDQALQTLAQQPFGTVLLLAVALGLVLYGVYSFARARYERL